MSIVRHLASYAPVHATGLLVGFGGVYVFTRLLGADDYGLYALMFSVGALVQTATLTWTEAAAFRFAGQAEAENAMDRHIATVFTLWLRSLALTALILMVLTAAFWQSPRYLAVLPWVAVAIPLRSLIQLCLELHRAEQQTARYVAAYTALNLGGFILGGLIAWWLAPGAAAPFMGVVVLAVLVSAVEAIWLLARRRGAEPSGNDVQRAYFAFGAPIAAALLMNILLSAGDRFLIAWFLGEGAVGAYAAGYGLADQTVLMICAWAAMAVSPVMMRAWERDGPEAAMSEARGLLAVLFLAGVPAATGLALVAEPLAEIMVAEDLRAQAAEIIPWIAFAGLLNGFLIHYWTEAFQLARKSGERALLMVVPAVFNLVANLVLIPLYDLMGAVYATLASYALGNVLMALVGRRHVRLPLPSLSLVKVGLAAMTMALVVSVLPDPGGLLELASKGLAGVLVYGALVYVSNAGDVRALIASRHKSSETVSDA